MRKNCSHTQTHTHARTHTLLKMCKLNSRMRKSKQVLKPKKIESMCACVRVGGGG